MAQQTFSGVPAEFTAGEVLSSSDQNLLRDYLIATIKEGMTGDTGEILPMIMDLTNNRIILDAGGLEFSNGSLQTVAAAAFTWTGSTANGLGTYGSSTSIVAESTATYDGTTLELTGSGGGLKLDNLASSDANTLDDYEQGTATISFLPSSGSITMNATTCRYTKIGDLVTVSGQISVTSVSTPSGNTKITGLPFATYSGTTARPNGSAVLGGYSGTVDYGVSLNPGANETVAWIYYGNSTLMQGERFQASTEMQFTLTYQTAA